jgi:muramoyltetrapeptide carboxypeptidase
VDYHSKQIGNLFYKEYIMLKAPVLQPGDTIGIISPSWGGAGAFPHRVERGISQLESLGYKVKTAEHALNQNGYISDTAENRVQDIHDLFADPEVKMILAAIGGDHACHLLPLLDFDLIRQNPKIVMGYSDMTVLNVAIWQQTRLVTFNGPALITDFAEFPQMFDYTERYFLKAVAQVEAIGIIESSTWWTEEFLDWETKQDLERPRRQLEATGWNWLKPGYGEGPLIGGCLESLQHLRGTPYWPDWEGAVLFFETSEERPGPETVDGILMDYENMGVLEKLAGMIVGRPMLYTEKEKQRLREIILERTEKYHFPIICDMDFGHTSPQFTLPIGCRASIDSRQASFRIEEAAVREAGIVVVSASMLAGELDGVSDEYPLYLNKRTGEIVMVSEEALSIADEARPLDDLQDWEREMVETAQKIFETDDYLKLPTQFEIHEYDMMKRFCYTVEDEHLSDLLLMAIQGSGSFRRFKDTIYRYHIEEDWFAYKAEALREVALEWLEDNELSFTE